jgi:hypothetical protein
VGDTNGQGIPMGRGRVNEGDQGEGIWLMDFIHLYGIEQRTSCNCFKWGMEGLEGEDDGGDLTNVQYVYLELSQ